MDRGLDREAERVGEARDGRRPRGEQPEGQAERDGGATAAGGRELRTVGSNPGNISAMSEQDDFLDEEFPGDGPVETEATVLCPYCGELNEIALDPGSGTEQEYIEDCQVCCRPWRVFVTYQPDGTVEVAVEPESPD
jgi:hypothetical protein